MRRLHKEMLDQPTANDERLQKLILKQADNEWWVLTSAKSKSDVEKGIQVADFTKTPEWCDPKIFEASLTLLKTLK